MSEASDASYLSGFPDSKDPSEFIEGAKLAGASARWSEHPITANPFADMPGSFVLHAAWKWGWNNSEAVLEAEATGDWSAIDAA